jgi:hypothetical protein
VEIQLSALAGSLAVGIFSTGEVRNFHPALTIQVQSESSLHSCRNRKPRSELSSGVDSKLISIPLHVRSDEGRSGEALGP